MQTITNKKGNEGFTVTAWNFHSNYANGGASIDIVLPGGTISEKRTTVQFCIRQVRVHSCGKKVMRLEALKNGEYIRMRGSEFNPEMNIYTDMEAAEEFAKVEFDRVLPRLIDHECAMATRYETGVYEHNQYTHERIAAHREAAARLSNGTIGLEIVTR